jgi:hypothetical protein
MLFSIARSPGENASASPAFSASAPTISSRRLEPLRCLKRLASRSKKEGRSAGVSTGSAGLVLGPSSCWSEAIRGLPVSGAAAVSGVSFIIVQCFQFCYA